jgi:hypothetical protein
VPVLATAGVATIVLAACTAVEAAEREPLPAVSVADGDDESAPKTLTLTSDAVRRLELTTVVVKDPGRVPFAAVVYDKAGHPWVYASSKDRSFTRLPVTITGVHGGVATLSTGPPRGTRVVTRSAIKLYGAENGVGGGH